MFELHPKKVKVVATIGPASDNKEMILKLAQAGADIFRLNLSHRKKEESLSTIRFIRSVEKRLGRPLSILGDLAGPKIRIGIVADGTELFTGRKILITTKKVLGSSKEITVNFPDVLKNIEMGAEIYLGDGLIKLEAEKRINGVVQAKVIVGGRLISRMGFSAQGLYGKRFALSKKDREDIVTMVQGGADALAVSFVQTAYDIALVKKLLPKNKPPIVIAKIETMSGVKHVDDILDVADGLMVARGDLGFSVPLAQLPHIQKDLIYRALKKAKPVITATQMLESMMQIHFPTRAEVTDVANAVLDGSDALMLSGETALGKYPEEVIKTMRKIISESALHVSRREFPEEESSRDSISASVVRIADHIKAKLIVVLTQTGASARRISRFKPAQPIIALSSNLHIMHTLNFSWGVFPQQVKKIKNFNELIIETRKIALRNNVLNLKKGDPFVISAGVPFGESGSTNTVFINRV